MMNDILKNYGFEQLTDDTWRISRSLIDVDGASRDDVISFKKELDGRWVYLDVNGRLHFETLDVRDVLAFAQTFLASSIFQITGIPVEEGFDFEGTFYTSPYMFDDYFDLKVEMKNDHALVCHPEGDYRDAYLRWRDDFAERVISGNAKAPEPVEPNRGPVP